MKPLIALTSPNTLSINNPSTTMTIYGSNFTQSTQINIGGQIIDATYVDSGQVSIMVPEGFVGSLSIGGISVQAITNGETSNIVNCNVTGSSPVTLNDLQKIVDNADFEFLIQDNLDGTSDSFLKEIPSLQVYRVKDGDTLQGIASRVSNDASTWYDIVSINNLTYPYISDDPQDQIGKSNYTVYLSKRANSGDTYAYVNGVNSFISTGSVFYFYAESPLSDGTTRTISDIMYVDSVDQENNIVYFTNAIHNTYDIGFPIDVLTTFLNSNSRVVKTGDLILVPSNSNSSSFVNSESINYSNLYEILGTDIQLDQNGLIDLNSNGDFGAVSGIDNLKQSIVNRLATYSGELNYHVDYGTDIMRYVGKLNSREMAILATNEISKTLLEDPRVAGIKEISAQIIGDSININATIDINILNSSTTLNFVINSAS